MAAYLATYTLRMRTLFWAEQLWFMTRIREEEEVWALTEGASDQNEVLD